MIASVSCAYSSRIAFIAMMTFLDRNEIAFAPDPAQAAEELRVQVWDASQTVAR